MNRTDDIADTENRASYSLMFQFILSPGKCDCKLIFLYRKVNRYRTTGTKLRMIIESSVTAQSTART